MDNVINLFSRSKSTAQSQAAEQRKTTATDAAVVKQESLVEKKDFKSISERNAAIQERLRRERAEANKGVLKSYRIK